MSFLLVVTLRLPRRALGAWMWRTSAETTSSLMLIGGRVAWLRIGTLSSISLNLR